MHHVNLIFSYWACWTWGGRNVDLISPWLFLPFAKCLRTAPLPPLLFSDIDLFHLQDVKRGMEMTHYEVMTFSSLQPLQHKIPHFSYNSTGKHRFMPQLINPLEISDFALVNTKFCGIALRTFLRLRVRNAGKRETTAPEIRPPRRSLLSHTQKNNKRRRTAGHLQTLFDISWNMHVIKRHILRVIERRRERRGKHAAPVHSNSLSKLQLRKLNQEWQEDTNLSTVTLCCHHRVPNSSSHHHALQIS